MVLERTGRQSEMVERGQPSRCPDGHRLGPHAVIVGYLPCICAGGSGHRTFACRACGATIYQTEHDRNELPPPR